MCAAKILTTGGFTKLLNIPQPEENNKNKVVLYHLENPTSEKVKKAKEAILQELGKGWTYVGNLGVFEHEIQDKSYLLREGTTLELIDGSEIAGRHQIKISNTTSCLFESIVKVGGNLDISGTHATVVFNLPSIPQESTQPIQLDVYSSNFLKTTVKDKKYILHSLSSIAEGKSRFFSNDRREFSEISSDLAQKILQDLFKISEGLLLNQHTPKEQKQDLLVVLEGIALEEKFIISESSITTLENFLRCPPINSDTIRSTACSALGNVVKRGASYAKQALGVLFSLLRNPQSDRYGKNIARNAITKVVEEETSYADDAFKILISFLEDSQADSESKIVVLEALREIVKGECSHSKDAFKILISFLKDPQTDTNLIQTVAFSLVDIVKGNTSHASQAHTVLKKIAKGESPHAKKAHEALRLLEYSHK